MSRHKVLKAESKMERTNRKRDGVEEDLGELWFEASMRHNPLGRPRGAGYDPFLNPVEYALRENLAHLLDQVQGEMDPSAVKAALQNIVRIRAVQDITEQEALEFVPLLKPILLRHATGYPEDFSARIDQMADWAAEEYALCRARIAELRTAEGRRGLHLRRAEMSARAQQATTIVKRQSV